MGCWQTKSMPPPSRLQEEEEKVSTDNEKMHKRYENRQVRASTVSAPTKSSLHGRSASGNKWRTATKSSALPWKANVLTVFGPGIVTNIARKSDGIAQVTLSQWRLSGSNTVKIYSPAFAIKKHHRNLSSGIDINFNSL